jgi:integrase
MAAESSPTGAASRQQVHFNGAKVPNLYSRRLADGTTRFEFTAKVKGRVVKRTLAATSARQAVREIENLKPVARQGGIGQGSIRFGELVDRFLQEAEAGSYFRESGPFATATVRLYRQQLADHVRDQLGESRRVRDITQSDVQQLIDRLRLKLSGSTCRGVVTAISAVFTYGRRRGLVQANPTRDLLMPSTRRQSEPVYLDRDSIDALIESQGVEFRPVIATLAYTGLRISEALGLVWSNVDLQAGTLTVEQQLGRDGRSRAELKTASSKGTLSLPEPLIAELRAHRARLAERGLDRVSGDRLVFQTRSGLSPGRRNCLRALQVQAAKLGIRGQDGEPVGLHDLRHSLASTLRGLGWTNEQVAPILRHANARTTAMLYGGLSNDALVSIREQAAAALG